MKEVSIIIPVYNTEKYLRRCLDSIVTQTYKDFEVILVDDGSTDGSGKICDEYAAKDKRFKVIHNENRGVGYSRNYGLERVNGKYISFVDSDDWLDSCFYEKLLPEIEKFDLVYVSDFFYYPDGSIVTHILPRNQSVSRERVEQSILYLKKNDASYPFFGFTWNKLFRADIIKKFSIRFIENLNLCEDEVFTDAYCKYINSVSFVSEPLYYYRSNMSGLTSRKKSGWEYMTLANGIKINICNYKNPELLQYEHERIIYFITKAILITNNNNQLKKYFRILRICTQEYNIQIGRILRYSISLGTFGAAFFKLCRMFFRLN